MTVVLLHPLPLDGSTWNDVVDQIDDDVDVVATLYALGESMRDWASAVVDLLGPGAHTIVGNSVGASCAAEVAHLAPERVKRLVLVGGKLGHRPEPNLRDEAVCLLSSEGPEAAWARYWEPLFGPATDAGVIEAARDCFLAQGVDDVVRGVRVFHGREDRSDLCERWRGRLDVVSGSHDRSPTSDAAAAGLKQAAEGGLHVIADVGHYVPLEAPNQLAEIINNDF